MRNGREKSGFFAGKIFYMEKFIRNKGLWIMLFAFACSLMGVMDGSMVMSVGGVVAPEVEDQGVATEEEIVETPRGRAAMLAAFREANPDAEDDVGDDDLFDFSAGRTADAESRYGELAGANTRLSELAAGDPKLMMLLSSIASEGGGSLPYNVAKIYGKDFLSMEGEALDDFEKGYQENLAKLAEDGAALEAANQNIEEYQSTLEQFGRDNSLSEEELGGLNTAIYDAVMNALNGIIPVSFVEHIYKGMNYDADVQEAADTGVIEGKNTVIDAKMRKLDEVRPVGGGITASTAKAAKVSPNRSFYDGLEDV